MKAETISMETETNISMHFNGFQSTIEFYVTRRFEIMLNICAGRRKRNLDNCRPMLSEVTLNNLQNYSPLSSGWEVNSASL